MAEVEEVIQKAEDLINRAKEAGVVVAEGEKMLELAKKLNQLADKIERGL